MKRMMLAAVVLGILVAGGCGPAQQSATAPGPGATPAQPAPAPKTTVAPQDLAVSLGGPVDLGLDSLLKDPDAVVATVGDQKITNRMMHDRLKMQEERLQAQGQRITPQEIPQVVTMLRREVLKQMIKPMVLVALASAENVVPTTPEVESELADLTSSLKSQNQYEQLLAQQGWTPDDLREFVRKQVVVNQLLAKHVSISDASIQQVYEANKQQMQRPEMVHARHILFSTPEEATAEKVLSMVKAGSDFAELAQQYSADPGSRSRGGDLGFFPKGQMVSEFDDALAALKDGETAPDLVHSPFGFHIIRREETRAAGTAPLEEIHDRLKEYLEKREFDRWLQSQQERMAITFTDPEDDPAKQPAMPMGGGPPPGSEPGGPE